MITEDNLKQEGDMKLNNVRSGQNGLAHVALIVIVVAVVAVIGFAGYKIMSSKDSKGGDTDTNASTTSKETVQQAIKAQCDRLKDDDLCKFYTKFKEHEQFRMTSDDGAGAKSVIEVDGDNLHITVSGTSNYETIIIKDATYMKGKDSWYKQAAAEGDSTKPADAVTETFSDFPADLERDKTTYVKLGKEACGNLQCFKYEFKDSTQAENKQYMWFDDKDYQLRRVLVEAAEYKSDLTVEYTNVSIKAPSPVKELTANQYLDPTSGEVVTLPSGADGL